MLFSTNAHALRTTILGISMSLMAASTAQATPETWDVLTDPTNGFGGATSSWGLSDADSAYAAWNVFDAYPSDATPDAGSFGLGSASVTENTGGAFTTGGGNIYSFSVPTEFTVDLSGGTSGTTGGLRTIAIRIETLGSFLDPASVLLSVAGGSSAIAPTTSSLVFEDLLGGFGGAEQERAFIWENVADGDYAFDFSAASSSMSLSQVAVFMSPTVVPEPGTALLMGLGLTGLASVRRKQK